MLTNLRQRGAAKPRTIKTLISTIQALFSKQLTENDVRSLIEALKEGGHINTEGAKVSYSL